ncbi:hypothetical protein ACFO4P_17160 [Epilithonimonas pallida]|uniref:Uncharacterized protein n=1 Tax=Epilithonimonas pallida TaxID=373671 RepID=A0ABY1R4F4_9FLAO|nr:hypothetical protein [Epilithonimonas pallida]SMP94719.1 hypothetical protein SAMN05421679_106118 [Epilithonimonas pallida]
MNADTKIQKLSDLVYHELKSMGYCKLFNWEDYDYFKKQTFNKFNQVEAIVNLFLFYANDESDFSDYEF